MNNLPLQFYTYFEKQKQIAERFSRLRKQQKLSREKISNLSGVPYETIRRFERDGEISLSSLVKLCLAMQLYDDIDNLFKERKNYKTIEDVMNDEQD